MNNYYKYQKHTDNQFDIYRHTYSPAYHGLGRTTHSDLHMYWPERSGGFLAMRWGPFSKKPESFLTNVVADSPRIEEYKQYAKQLGTSIIVKDNATTVSGQPLPSHKAIYIADVTKRGDWWKLAIGDTLNDIEELLTGHSNPMKDNGDFFTKPKACNCAINTLMRDGCQCGGV